MTEPAAAYAVAAHPYRAKGWHPVPLPEKAKKSPPVGYTGYAGAPVGGPEIQSWIEEGFGPPHRRIPAGNVALRMPETVLGLDLDAYDGKPGLTTMLEALAELGILPPTPRSTSRATDPLSGIKFYRVPAGRRWADVLGPGVEVIHHGHRYAVAAPSVHDVSGAVYRWYAPDGTELDDLPAIGDLPDLPEAWVTHLDRGDVASVAGKADMLDAEVRAWLDALPLGEPCAYLVRLLTEAEASLAPAASRHDTARGYIARMVRAGDQGHSGAVVGLDSLQSVWAAAMRAGAPREPDHGEWHRMVTGAVAIVVKDPTPETDKGCCTDVDAELENWMEDILHHSDLPAEDETAFWSARPLLRHLRTFAHARRVAPWAVLGVVLARIISATPNQVHLPPLVGGKGSLNMFLGLVGASGDGKGAAEAAARDAVQTPYVPSYSAGSGEGIAHGYKVRIKGQLEWLDDAHAVLFTVPEIDSLGALGDRRGATLLPQLRSAWSGEQLGFGYADPTKRILVEAHEYRLCLIVGIQPTRAGWLLDDSDGGTPQRFVWLPTTDPTIPDVRPAEPKAWPWEPPPLDTIYGTWGHMMTVCDLARDTIDAARLARGRGEGDALNGHALYCQLKVAAALAIADGRYDVTDEDWGLADVVARKSAATRAGVAEALKAKARAANVGRAEADGHRAVIVGGVIAEDSVKRVCRTIVRKLQREGVVKRRDLRSAVWKRDRGDFPAALEKLVDAGQIVADETGYRMVEP